MNESSVVNAQSYAAQRELEIAERLGSGKDGIVFVAKRKITPARVAIKAHRFAETYLREKLAYERLQQTNTGSICGFNVPKIVNSNDELRILEMTIVDRPFVLDFAAAYLDRGPEFPSEIWQSRKLKNASNLSVAGLLFNVSSTCSKRWGFILWMFLQRTLPFRFNSILQAFITRSKILTFI